MNELLVGYARVSTEQQDLTAQRNGLHALGVGDDRIYVDHGLSGNNRDRPGLRLALAACRAGDTLVVTKLDRLARSLPNARDILDELTRRNVKLSLGGSIHDPTDPVGRLLFNVLAMVAEFESDLIRLRTREGMKVAEIVPQPDGLSRSAVSKQRQRRCTSARISDLPSGREIVSTESYLLSSAVDRI
jgi:DNA invertase Pin-like site-specific DNA recombinase